MKRSDRAQHAVLVPAAHSLGAIAAIRSLGRAGYRVHAAGAESALGLHSRFADRYVISPPSGSPEGRAWFDAYVREHAIEMVIPGGGFDVAAAACQGHEALFPNSRDAAQIAVAQSKYRLFEALARTGGAAADNLPPYLLVDLDRELPTLADLAALGAPLFIKLDDALRRTPGGGDDVIRVADAEAAGRTLGALAGTHRAALVQGFVPGAGAGAFALRWDGRLIARMMHRRLHEMPHTGGASSYRMSWWHGAMMADAEAKLEAIGWDGPAMVDYRWDRASGRFALMEMNLRFWGSLHLCLYAGADFPTMLADSFFGAPPETLVEGVAGVRCRHLVPGELGYLSSLWCDPAVPMARKIGAAVEAVGLTLDPAVRSDLLFPGDRGLFWRQLARAVRRTR